MLQQQNYATYNGIQIIRPALCQTKRDNCSHLATALHIDRTIRLGYASLNPPYSIELNQLIDHEAWENELRTIKPSKWPIWNVLKIAESTGFVCWNARRQKVDFVTFVDKVGNDSVAVDVDSVSDLLRRYKSIAGAIKIKIACYVPDEVWYIDDSGLEHQDTHAVAIFGELDVTSTIDGIPKGKYWLCQDSNALTPVNSYGILIVSASLLIEAYSSLSMQPVLMARNQTVDCPYPVPSILNDFEPCIDGKLSQDISTLLSTLLYPIKITRQPEPPEVSSVFPCMVSGPEPGLAKQSEDVYLPLHIPEKLMDNFMKLANEYTVKNLEFCGVLGGCLKNHAFYITTLIIPKQRSTFNSCEALNEEEIFEVQNNRSILTLGWIHTHQKQACFMSSIDLHTHYSYQIMLPEAIAIVMAPTDSSRPYGIFHLSDPGGVSVIRNCQQSGFHSHCEPEDGSPLYKHCPHVLHKL